MPAKLIFLLSLAALLLTGAPTPGRAAQPADRTPARYVLQQAAAPPGASRQALPVLASGGAYHLSSAPATPSAAPGSDGCCCFSYLPCVARVGP